MARMCPPTALFDLTRWGRAARDSTHVPRPFTPFIKSYFLTDVADVGVNEMADALLMRMSSEPKRSTVAWTAASQLSASRTSITIARPLPPACSICLTAS